MVRKKNSLDRHSPTRSVDLRRDQRFSKIKLHSQAVRVLLFRSEGVPSPKTLEQQDLSSCSDWTLPSDWEQQDGASTFQDSLSPRQMAVLEKLI
jgi:hypothetical protein